MAVYKYIPLAAAFEAETGTRPSPATLWRFYTKGSGGVVLKTWMLGGRRVTTPAEVRAFIDKRTAASASAIQVDQDKRAKELAAELA